MSSRDDFVVNLLVEHGLVDQAVVDVVQGRHDESVDLASAPRSLVDRLISEKTVEASAITELLSREFQMPVVDLKEAQPDHEAIEALPRDLAEKYHVLPLGVSGNTLRLALSDPFDVQTIDSLSHVLRFSIEPYLASYHDIAEEIHRCYGVTAPTVESFLSEIAVA